MNYSEKLKDVRWLNFRAEFIQHRLDENLGEQCDDCGEDTESRTLHVHHRLYRRGAEPWEYDFDELRLVCCECHKLIHDTEQRVRALVLTVSPHVCFDINNLLDELEALPTQARLKLAMAHARRSAIALQHLPLAGEEGGDF